MEEFVIVIRFLLPTLLAVSLVVPAMAHADSGVSYSPSPGFAGSAEQFSACGLQEGETADVTIDTNAAGQATVLGGCASVSFTTPLDMAPNTPHLVSVKGEQSGKEQDGAYLVMPPTIPAPPAPVMAGGTTVVNGLFFAPGRAPMTLGDVIVPGPGAVDFSGNFMAPVTVLPNTPAGTYPIFVRDDPWLANPPTTFVTVLPQPSASPQTAPGNWTLNVASTMGKDDGKLSVKASSSFNAPFSVSGSQLSGNGQLTIGVDLSGPTGDSCHGDSQIPFQVGGTQDAAGFHLTFTGINASAPVNVTCNNGISMPFALPAGAGSAPFDIEATDGKTIDLDGSNLFMMVPAGFTGGSHAVLTRS
jgi:hypothetical protein